MATSPAGISKKVALKATPAPVSSDAVGEVWAVLDMGELGRLIGRIALGQATHVSAILTDLEPAAPAPTFQEMKDAAIRALTVRSGDDPWRRDGFLFEAISWIVARQSAAPSDFMRDPHLKSTTQGLDGLLIRVSPPGTITKLIIFEDKCTDNPRGLFKGSVLPSFKTHHRHERAPELVAAVAELLRQAKLKDADMAIAAATAVRDLSCRSYKASLTVAHNQNTQSARAALFADYEELDLITQGQRIGATFVMPNGDLRPWFESLAQIAIEQIKLLPVI